MTRRLGLLLPVLFALPLCAHGCERVKALVGAGQDPKPGVGEEQGAAAPAGETGKGGRIAMVLSFEDYQDKEYEVPRKKFEEAGYSVEVVSFFAGEAKGALGGKAKVDTLLEDATGKVGDYAAVVFVGGPGSVFYHGEKKAHELVQEAAKQGKVVAAICLAPFTLANAGVLEGVKATVWTGGDYTPERFGKTGAFYRDEPVVVDGRFVTANGPPAAEKFAAEILRLLDEGAGR